MEPEGLLPCPQEPATGPYPRLHVYVQSTSSHSIFLRSIPISSSYPRLGLPSGLCPSDISTKILFAFLIPPMCSTCPAHLTSLEFITLIIFGKGNELWGSSLCNFLQPPATSSLLDPRIILYTLFSSTINLLKLRISVLWLSEFNKLLIS